VSYPDAPSHQYKLLYDLALKNIDSYNEEFDFKYAHSIEAVEFKKKEEVVKEII
jgi:hypothetical protein